LKIIKTKLDGVLLLEPKVFADGRGFFQESYSKKMFQELGLEYELIQDNHSLSVEAGTLRGLHYQISPKAQTKIVRVVTGAILDVVVDIRRGSPTYGEHITAILSADNHRQILIPKGFAHGLLTLVPNVHLLYKVDEFYSFEHDRNIRWDDPELNIDWNWNTPILSEKDREAPLLKDADNNFVFEQNR
jgi:dTDP-4-dehydrorhamnose 3,5-epimerase